MKNLEMEFEQAKNEILAKIQRTKEKWQLAWQEAQGYPAKEMELIHIKLEMQITEAHALDKLKEMEKKVREATSE